MNFFGSNLVPEATTCFHVSESQHAMGVSKPIHSHDYCCILFVLSGVHREEIESEKFLVNVGEVLYKPANVLHRNNFEDAGSRICRIQFYDASVRNASVLSGRLPNRPIQLQSPLLSNVFSRIQAELATADSLTSFAIDCLCWEVIFQIVRHVEGSQNVRRHESVQRVIERLKSEYRSPPRVSDLADWVGVHRSQLARQFRRQTDMTIAEFVRHQRVQNAIRLLDCSDIALSSVAIECGFVDQSHFTSSFRRVTGFTPSAWRNGQKLH